MNERIFNRLNEINKEIEEIERNEEKDMNREDFLESKIMEFIEMDDKQIEIYQMYRTLINKGSRLMELFDGLTDKGCVEITRVIIKGYVRDIWLNDELNATREELENIALMHIALMNVAPEEKELDAYMAAIVETGLKQLKGGE